MASYDVPAWMQEIVQTAEIYQPAVHYAKVIQDSIAPVLSDAQRYAAQMRELQAATMPEVEAVSQMNNWLTSMIAETDEAKRLAESFANQLAPIVDAAERVAREVVPAASLLAFSRAVVDAINVSIASTTSPRDQNFGPAVHGVHLETTITSSGSVSLPAQGTAGRLDVTDRGVILSMFAQLSQAEMTFVVLVWVVATLLIARDPTPPDAIGYYGAAYGIARMIMKSQRP